MPADLSVDSVAFGSLPLRAPCPQTLLVTIVNLDSDPPDPVPFDVTIDFEPRVGRRIRFVETITPGEGQYQQLAGRGQMVVPVEVRLPCHTSAPFFMNVTVDEMQQVPNNLRNAPPLQLGLLTSIQSPWLSTTLRVGSATRWASCRSIPTVSALQGPWSR
jgi:hypothetical protein